MKKLFIAAITIACVGALNASPPGTHATTKTCSLDEKNALNEEARIPCIASADIGKHHYVVPLVAKSETLVLTTNDGLLQITGKAPCRAGQQATSGMKDATTAGNNKAPCPTSGNDTLYERQAIIGTAKLQVPEDVGKTSPALYSVLTGKKAFTINHCRPLLRTC